MYTKQLEEGIVGLCKERGASDRERKGENAKKNGAISIGKLKIYKNCPHAMMMKLNNPCAIT
jgi:hypothetical protein